MHPSTEEVRPARSASAASMQSPPASAEAHQGQHLVPRVRPPRRIPEVKVTVNEFTQAHVLGQGGRKKQPGIVDQAVVVEGDLDTVGGFRLLVGYPCPTPP